MNTNTIQVITFTVAVGLIAGFMGLEVSGDLLTGVAIGVSYFSVAALYAMTVSNYRTSPKPYFVTPVVTGHFQSSVPASPATRTRAEKARLAA